MKRYRKLTAQEKERAKRLLADGLSLQAVAEFYDVVIETVKRATDPEWAAWRKATTNAARLRRKTELPSVVRKVVHSKAADTEAAKQLAQIPIDTRTELQRMMGEPMPERSALYRKQTGGEA